MNIRPRARKRGESLKRGCGVKREVQEWRGSSWNGMSSDGGVLTLRTLFSSPALLQKEGPGGSGWRGGNGQRGRGCAVQGGSASTAPEGPASGGWGGAGGWGRGSPTKPTSRLVVQADPRLPRLRLRAAGASAPGEAAWRETHQPQRRGRVVPSPATRRFPAASSPPYGQEAEIREVKALARAHTAESSENRFEPPCREAAPGSAFSESPGGPAARLSLWATGDLGLNRGWKSFDPPTAT